MDTLFDFLLYCRSEGVGGEPGARRSPNKGISERKFGKENKLINCRVLPLSSQSRNAGNEINCLQETFLETFANQISFLQKVIIQMAL